MDSSTYKQPFYSRSARCHTNRASYMDKTRKLAHIPEWRWHSECSRLSSKCTLGVGDIQNVADSHQNAHSKSLRSESQRQNSSSFHQPASSSKTWKNCRTVPWRQLKTNRGAWGYPDLQDQAWLLQYYYSTLDNSPLHKRLTPSDEDSWQNW